MMWVQGCAVTVSTDVVDVITRSQDVPTWQRREGSEARERECVPTQQELQAAPENERKV